MMESRRRRREGSESGQRSPLHWLLRWTYARWVQALAHGDLLGRDGRPSQSKLAAFTVLATGCFCAIWQSVHGTEGAGTIGAATVTVILSGLAASFGIRTFNHFLDRSAIQLETKQLDETVRVIAERRTKGGGMFEPTHE